MAAYTAMYMVTCECYFVYRLFEKFQVSNENAMSSIAKGCAISTLGETLFLLKR